MISKRKNKDMEIPIAEFSLIKKVSEDVTCPVCYQFYKNPKLLPCNHSYCEECLEKMQEHSKIICPVCRNEAIVPAGGVKILPTNFSISKIMDKVALKQNVKDKELKCDECVEKDPVVAYCQDCKSNLCHFCCENHKRSKRFCGHGIVSLTDITIQQNAVALMCKEHNLELLLYCNTCKQLVCKHCLVKGHHGHTCTNARTKVCKCQIELEKATVPVEEVLKNLSEAHDDTIDKMNKKTKENSPATKTKEDSPATKENINEGILLHILPVDGPYEINCDGQNGGCFVWKDCGLEINFPPKCSQQHVQVTVSTFLPIRNVLHPSIHIVSAVYQFDCNVKRFDKAFTLGLQHCIELQSPEDCQKMRFIIQHDGDNDVKYGHFEVGNSYGTVNLHRFCCVFIAWIFELGRIIRTYIVPVTDDQDNTSLPVPSDQQSSTSSEASSEANSEECPTSQTNHTALSQSVSGQQHDSSVPSSSSTSNSCAMNKEHVESKQDNLPVYNYESMIALPRDYCHLPDWFGVYSIYVELGRWRKAAKDSILSEEVISNFKGSVDFYYADKIKFGADGIVVITCEKASETITVNPWPSEIKKKDINRSYEDYRDNCGKDPFHPRHNYYNVLRTIVRKSVIRVMKTNDAPLSNCHLIIKGIIPHQQVDLCTNHCTNFILFDTVDSQSATNVNTGPILVASATQQSHMYMNIDFSQRLRQSGILEKEPEMRDLIINVIPLLNADWEDVAYLLYYTNSKINSIKELHNKDPYKCCRELLKDWLESSRGICPKNWGTLLNTIAESGNFTKRAKDIIKFLERKIVG